MKLDKRLKKTLDKHLNECFKNGQVNQSKIKQTVKYFQGLPSKSLAIFLMEYYLDGIKLRLNQGSLQIQSAVELSQTQIKQIEELIKSKAFVYNTKVTINSNLLGGMRVQIGDKVMENTIEKQIEQIGQLIHG